MPPKANSKKVEGQNRKAEVAEGKKAAKQSVVDKKEDAEWEKGSKGKGAKEDKEDKAAKKEAAREELRKLTLAEEAAQPSKKPTLKPVKAAKPGPAKIVPATIPDFGNTDEEPTAYEASNIDDALAILNLVSEKTDKASVGSKASKIELHPERRFKAAFEEYKEAQMPIIRKDYPGLRLQQYHDRLYKDFQKAPENPFNNETLQYNATQAEKVDALKRARDKTANRLRAD